MFLFLIFGLTNAAAPGTDPCTTYSTQSACSASGYCSWSGSCQAYTSTADCYRIDEIAACRTGGLYATGVICQPLASLSVQYSNVCGITATVDYNYVRFPISSTGLSTHSLTGLTVAQLSTAIPQANFLYQVFTVNLQIASNTELQSILDLYKTYLPELIKTTTHPFYLEKALFNTLQNLRDDTSGLTNPIKQLTMTKFWDIVINVYFPRLLIYSKQYQTNYYFLNFAQTTFSTLYLTLNGQDHTTTLSWAKYTKNGYMQVVSYAPKVFGITDALSDVIFVKVIDQTSTAFTGVEGMQVTYAQNTGTLTNVVRTLKYISDKTAFPHTFTTTVSSPACDAVALTCVFTLASPLSSDSFAFYIMN